MSIKETKRRIAGLQPKYEHSLNGTILTTEELHALADSHTKLLEAAKEALRVCPQGKAKDMLFYAISDIELIFGSAIEEA